MRRFAALVCAISVALVVAPAGEAEACSCAALDPLEMLEDSDAAFVGTLVERPTEPIAGDEFEGVWVFEVEEWVKGDLGSPVGVHAALDGAACGLEMEEGDRAGIFLHNREGRPSGGLCSTTSPEALLAAEEPLVLDGTGPPIFLVAAPSGRARLATLDASGRLLEVAGGDGPVWAVSACPGGQHVVETTDLGAVAIRDLSDLQIIDEVPIEDGQLEQVWCLDDGAGEILGHFWDEGSQERYLQMVGGDRPIHRGDHHALAVGQDHVAISFQTTVQLVSLIDGETTRITTRDEPSAVAFSPDGSRLLVAVTNHPPSGGFVTQARLYDTATGNLNWESDWFPDASIYGWLDDERLTADVYPLEAEAPRKILIGVGTGGTTEWGVPGFEFFPVEEGVVASEEGVLYLVTEGEPPAEIATLPSPHHRLVSVLDPAADIQATPVPTPPTVEEESPPAAAPSQEPETNYIPIAVALTVVVAGAGVVAAVAVRRKATSLTDVD